MEHRPEPGEGVIHANVWGKNIPGRINSKPNGFWVGTRLAFSRNSKEANVIGAEVTKVE